MEQKLKGKRVAILVTHGFEQVELTEPRKALQEAGATAHVVSPAEGRVKGWNFTQWGDELRWTCRSRRRARTTTTPCCCLAA